MREFHITPLLRVLNLEDLFHNRYLAHGTTCHFLYVSFRYISTQTQQDHLGNFDRGGRKPASSSSEQISQYYWRSAVTVRNSHSLAIATFTTFTAIRVAIRTALARVLACAVTGKPYEAFWSGCWGTVGDTVQTMWSPPVTPITHLRNRPRRMRLGEPPLSRTLAPITYARDKRRC